MKTIDRIPTSKIQRASKLVQTGAKVGVNYLKYYGDKNLEKIDSKDLKSKFKNVTTWCAASTHKSEEIFLGTLHKKLKKFNKRIITIIIQRHINRTSEIINDMNKLGLKTIAKIGR